MTVLSFPNPNAKNDKTVILKPLFFRVVCHTVQINKSDFIMKKMTRLSTVLLGISLVAGNVLAQDSATPYKVLDTTKLMGSGGIDFVYADNDGRRVYVPRGVQTFVFDLDSHQYIGAITNCGGRGVVVD